MENYLVHHGVKGMKWGVRHDERKALRGNLRAASKEYRSTKFKRDWAFGQAERKKTAKANKDASLKYMNSLVDYKVGKAKNKKQALKAERNAYTRSMYKFGLRGSVNDMNYGGRSTAAYNEIKKKKGKKYADMIESRTEKQLYATIAGATAVAIGSAYISASMYSY